MPVTDTKTLHRELDKFGTESEGRNEAFIKALTTALQNQLVAYANQDESTSDTQSLAVRSANRIADVRRMFETAQFQVGKKAFGLSTAHITAGLGSAADSEPIQAWVAALEASLLNHYRQATVDQRLQRLGEISLMFRASTFQVGQQTLKIAADGASAATNIASFQGTYGCPPGTSCIDGNCV